MGRPKLFEDRVLFTMQVERWERDKIVQMGGGGYIRELCRLDWESDKWEGAEKLGKKLKAKQEFIANLDKQREKAVEEEEAIEKEMHAAQRVDKQQQKWKEAKISSALNILRRYKDGDILVLKDKATFHAKVLKEHGIEVTTNELLGKLEDVKSV